MGRRSGLVTLSSPGTLEEIQEDISTQSSDGGWIVTVYDNDENTIDEVVFILIVATGCTIEEAEMETWEIHNLGRSVVHHGSESDCHRVGEIISTIGIKVEVTYEG